MIRRAHDTRAHMHTHTFTMPRPPKKPLF